MSSFSLILQKEKYFLIFLFIFSFVLRAAFFNILIKDKRYWICKDSTEYHIVADQISHGNGISDANGNSTFFRVPGYSIFLATFYKIFDFNVLKTLWVQVVLSSFIPIFVFFLALVFFPGSFVLAKFSSVFIAVSIGSILNSALLMSDSLFALFFLIFLVLFFSSFQSFLTNKISVFSWQRFFIAGLFLGVASLIRPVGQYVILISVLLLFFSNFSFRYKISSSFFLFIGWLLIVFWWLFRNWLLTGLIFFHSMPGIHFLNYLACEVDSKANRCTYLESKDKLLRKLDGLVLDFEQKNGTRVDEIGKSDMAFLVARETVQKYPLVTVKHCFVNFFKTCFSLHSSVILFLFSQDWPNYSGATSLWEKVKHHLFLNTKNKFFQFLVYYELLFLLVLWVGFLGFLGAALYRKKLWDPIIRYAPIIFLFILLTFGSGVARLRLTIEPMLAIFAFYFWLNILFKGEFGDGK